MEQILFFFLLQTRASCYKRLPIADLLVNTEPVTGGLLADHVNTEPNTDQDQELIRVNTQPAKEGNLFLASWLTENFLQATYCTPFG